MTTELNETIQTEVKKPRKAYAKGKKETVSIAEMRAKMEALENELREKEEKLANIEQAKQRPKVPECRDTIYRNFKKHVVKDGDNYDPKIGFQKYGESKWKHFESGTDVGFYRQVYINLAPLANNPRALGY